MNKGQDKIENLYGFMPEGAFRDVDELRGYVTDEEALRNIYDLIPEGAFRDEDEFVDYFSDAIKKKDSFFPSLEDIVPTPKDVAEGKELPGVKKKEYIGPYRQDVEYEDLSTEQKEQALRSKYKGLDIDKIDYLSTLPKEPTLEEMTRFVKTRTAWYEKSVLELEKNYERDLWDIASQVEDKEDYDKKAQQLQEQYIERADKLFDEAQSFRFLDEEDARQIRESVRSIVQSDNKFGDKSVQLARLTHSFTQKLPKDLANGVRREINAIIGQEAMIDEDGSLSPFAIKQEAALTMQDAALKLRNIEQEISRIDREIRKTPFRIGKDLRVDINEDLQKTRFALVKQQEKYNFIYKTAQDILQLPDDKGSFVRALAQSFDESLYTLGISDVYDAAQAHKAAKAIAKGEPTEADYDLVKMVTLLELGKQGLSWTYKAGEVTGEAIPFMAQIFITKGLGSFGAKTIQKLFKQGVKRNLAQKALQFEARALGQAVPRVPFMTVGYERAFRGMAGQPTIDKETGKITIDVGSMEKPFEAIAKGAFTNLTEVFFEGQGELIGRGVGKTVQSAANKFGIRIPKTGLLVHNLKDATMFNGWLGEYVEELPTEFIQSTVTEGRSLTEAWQDVKEASPQIALSTAFMSGVFASLSIPGWTADFMTGRKLGKAFGKPVVEKLDNAFASKDYQKIAEELDAAWASLPDDQKNEENFKQLFQYSMSMAYIRGGREASREAEKHLKTLAETSVPTYMMNGKKISRRDAISSIEAAEDIADLGTLFIHNDPEVEAMIINKFPDKVQKTEEDAKEIREEAEAEGEGPGTAAQVTPEEGGIPEGGARQVRVRDTKEDGLEAEEGEIESPPVTFIGKQEGAEPGEGLDLYNVNIAGKEYTVAVPEGSAEEVVMHKRNEKINEVAQATKTKQRPMQEQERADSEYARETDDISRQDFDRIAQQAAPQLDIENPTYEGSGAMGVAYNTKDGRILKITTDVSEANAAIRLMEKHREGFAKVHDVRKVVDKETGKIFHAIVEEKVKDVGSDKIKRVRDIIDKTLDGWGEWIIKSTKKPRKEAEQEAKGILTNNPDANISKEDRQMAYEHAMRLYDIAQGAYDIGFRKVMDLTNEQNLGYDEDGNLVFFDLGLGPRRVPDIPPERTVVVGEGQMPAAEEAKEQLEEGRATEGLEEEGVKEEKKVSEKAPKGKKPAKESAEDIKKRLKEQKERAKGDIADGLDIIMSAMGGKKDLLIDPQDARVQEGIRKIAKGLGAYTAATLEEAVRKVLDYLSQTGLGLTAKDVENAIKDEYTNQQQKAKKAAETGKERKVKEEITEKKKTAERLPKKEKGGEWKQRKTQINSLIQNVTLQQRVVADIISKNREDYLVYHTEQVIADAKQMIERMGVRNATEELSFMFDRVSDFPVRVVARLVLIDFYSRALTDSASTEQDKETAYRAIDRLWTALAKESTRGGQGIKFLGTWKAMQPTGTLEFVVRKVSEGNADHLNRLRRGDKSVGDLLDELYDTLDKESKKIVDDILAGKKIDIAKKQVSERGKRPLPRKKYVPKEKVKQEQEYRKRLLEEYKRKAGGTAAVSVAGLTNEQIELAGNLIASYIKEGYYRLQDIVDKLQEDFKSVGVTLREQQINDMLSQRKEGNQTFRSYLQEVEAITRAREEIKDMGKKIDDIIREHWDKKDEYGRTLAQKLIDEAGLKGEEAARIEKVVVEEFRKQILERSEPILTKLLGTKRIPTKGKKKGLIDKFLEAVNMGALASDFYTELFADHFKLVQLNKEHAAHILKLASDVQKTKGRGRVEREAMMRLTKYVYELYPKSRTGELFETWIALAYANMLMGLSTTVLNLLTAGVNITTKPVRDITNLSKWLKVVKEGLRGDGWRVYNPIGDMFWTPMLHGILHGTRAARDAYVYGEIDNKYIENISKHGQFVVSPLERNKYGRSKRFRPIKIKIGGKVHDVNLMNAYKYSTRNLAAQDKMMLNTSYDMEVANILFDKFFDSGLRGRELVKRVMEEYRGDRIDQEELSTELSADMLLWKEMTGEEMSPLIAKIRLREMMLDRLGLTAEEQEEAEKLARSNIFTDERGGLIATMANMIGAISNRDPLYGLGIKPFIPFTRVVGNVMEYMLDYTPVYGFMRAHGYGMFSMLKKQYLGPDVMTSQMGPKGSRLYYEQMGRAWFGTLAFLLFAMMGIGNDEDDWLEISGGYAEEGWKKRGRENVMPKYSIRMGKFVVSYLYLPPLAVPLAIIGNYNDYIRMHPKEEKDASERLAAAMLYSLGHSTTIVKDMSFVEGIEKLNAFIGDLLSGNIKKATNTALKTYVGFLSRPLPQNNNAIQQIWKFFDPTSYSQSDIQGILAYAAGVQHFVGKPSVDQLGDIIETRPGETLMPYTFWIGLKGKDKRWKFLAHHNAIPTKIYNRQRPIETADGIEKRRMDADELYEYCLRSGKKMSAMLEDYMKDEQRVAARAKQKFEEDAGGGNVRILTGVQKDVEQMWSQAKDEAFTELFRWGLVKEEYPDVWEKIIKHEATWPYATSKQIDKYELDKDELYRYNTLRTEYYARYFVAMGLTKDKYVKKLKSIYHRDIEKTEFELVIDMLWKESGLWAEDKVRKEILAKRKKQK